MPDPVSSAVVVEHLSKRYGAVEAVRGVSFEVGGGEIFGLLGRNGAGKTTTLECVLGLRQPDGGRVVIAGIDAVAAPERAKAVVGAQLQAATLHEKITPRQALDFTAAFYRNPVPTRELLAEFALEAKADATFESLSGGQKQRLFLALAFVHRPRVVILDEPTAGLDPQARHDLHAVIVAARGRGVTVILSTHNLDEAERLCDRIGILHQGELAAVGTPAELVARVPRDVRVSIRTARRVDPATFAGLPGVRRAATSDSATSTARSLTSASAPAAGAIVFECTDVNQAIVSIVQQLTRAGNVLLDLQIHRPTLEEAFIELTGSAWEEEVDG